MAYLLRHQELNGGIINRMTIQNEDILELAKQHAKGEEIDVASMQRQGDLSVEIFQKQQERFDVLVSETENLEHTKIHEPMKNYDRRFDFERNPPRQRKKPA